MASDEEPNLEGINDLDQLMTTVLGKKYAKKKAKKQPKKSWTEQEDKELLRAIDLHGNKWDLIKQVPLLQGKTVNQLQYHLKKLKEDFAGKSPLKKLQKPTSTIPEEQIPDDIEPDHTPAPKPNQKEEESCTDIEQDQEKILKSIIGEQDPASKEVIRCSQCHKQTAVVECTQCDRSYCELCIKLAHEKGLKF